VVTNMILQVEGGQCGCAVLHEVMAWSKVDDRQPSTVASSRRKRQSGMELVPVLWSATRAATGC
jgi:hypothetical protein